MSAKKSDTKDLMIDPQMSYEDARGELQDIIRRIESGQIGLEESMAQYERGVALYRHCKAIQDQVEQKMAELTQQMQGEVGKREA